METRVTTCYLELLSVEDFMPSGREAPGLEIREARIACPELGRFLYTAVGRAWRWTDRLKKGEIVAKGGSLKKKKTESKAAK